MERSARWRTFAIGVSLANLLLLDVWRTLFLSSTPAAFSLDVRRSDFAAIVIAVLLLGAAFAVVAQLARASGRRWVVETTRVCFIASALLLTEAGRRINRAPVPQILVTVSHVVGGLRLVALAGIVAAIIVWRWRRPISSAYAVFCLILAPACVVTFGRALWSMATVPFELFEDLPPAPRPPAHLGQRVAVIIFDELDEQWAFDKRPAGLSLPAFDRFRAEATYGGAAMEPAGNTRESIPSYLIGQSIFRSVEDGPRSLEVSFSQDGRELSFDSFPNLFARVAQLGGTSGIVGNYLPYCRLALARYVQRCAWIPVASGGVSGGEERGLVGAIAHDMASLAPWSNRANHIDRYHQTLVSAVSMLTDTTLDFVFVHVGVPHAPTIFDRRRNTITVMNTSPTGYVDNLVLADRALGEMRSALERAGLWDGATVIVTSDHHWRTAPATSTVDPHVPFLVKLPHATARVPREESLKAVVLSDLVVARLGGEISDAGALARFFSYGFLKSKPPLTGVGDVRSTASLAVPSPTWPYEWLPQQ